MAAVALSELRRRAKVRADMEDSDFVTDAEWNSFINTAADELYDILVTKFEDDYVSDSPFTASGVTTSVSVPATFYKLLSVDVQATGKWVKLRRFNREERNTLRNLASASACDSRYQLRGSAVIFYPGLPNGTAGSIEFIPKRTALSGESDSVDFGGGWEEHIVLTAAIMALSKEESDISALTLEKQSVRARIDATAPNRDAAEPPRVRDVESGVDEFDWRDR